MSSTESKRKDTRRIQTVLIMDDEPVFREVLEKELRESGYEALAFANKEDGYDWACENHVDLVISDISSPSMDGLSLLRFLKENPVTSPIPVVIVTGFVGLDVATQCKKLGAMDFVSKPYELSELLHAIEQALRSPSEARYRRTRSVSSDLFISTKDDMLRAPWYRIRRFLTLVLEAQQSRTILFDQEYWWSEHFLIEDGNELVGCCLRRPTQYGRLSAREIYGFRRRLDSQGLRFGVMYSFFDADTVDVEFAELLGISVVPASGTLEILLRIAGEGPSGAESLVPSERGLKLSPLAGEFQTFLMEALQKAHDLRIPVMLTIDPIEPGETTRSITCEYTEHGSFNFSDELTDTSIRLGGTEFSRVLARLWRGRRIELPDLARRDLLARCIGEVLLILGLATRSDNTYYLKGE